MPDEPPVSEEQVVRYIERARLPSEGADIESFRESIDAQDDIVSKLDELPDRSSRTDREYWSPDEEEDVHAAFLTRCDIQVEDDTSDAGLLDGTKVAVKDNIAVAGIPMTCGSPFLEDFVPARDAAVVERLLAAGARIIGKANMDEFALGGDRNAMRFRLARNPADPDRQPGGSSAGSGVAVATGQAAVALGTDTGGSVRFPASFCGVIGIKPTRGLVPLEGFVQFSRTLDTIGTLSHNVESGVRALRAITDEAFGEKDHRHVRSTDADSLTVGVPAELWGIGSDVEPVVREALDSLERAGATVQEVSIDDFEFAIPAWLAIGMTEMAAYFDANTINYWRLTRPDPRRVDAISERFTERADELGEFVRDVLVYGQHLCDGHSDHYYAKAQEARRRVTTGVDGALNDVDVLASPTTPIVAPEWGEGYLEDGSLYEVMKTTAPFNLTGHPAVSVPCGTYDGMPVGLQFIGRQHAEADALAAARVWESIDVDT